MKSLFFFIIIIVLGVMAYSYYFLATVLVITFLIFFHELGHFLLARAVGIRVEVFSIGFGRPIFAKQIGNTQYRICGLLFGGYVKLKGQDDLNPSKTSIDADSYQAKGPLKRILVLFAGPAFNFILAFLLYVCVANLGLNRLLPMVGTVMPGSAAMQAGLVKGDLLLSIGGKKLSTFDEISKLLRNKPQEIKYLRNGITHEVLLRPKLGLALNEFNQKITKPMLGITPQGKLVKVYYKGSKSLIYAYDESIKAASLIFLGVKKLLTHEVPSSSLGGIFTMIDITSKASATSFATLLLISALISINLGVLNLIPIPALDGGHIVFNLYELIFRKPFPRRIFEILSYIGIALLCAIMIFAIYNDFLRMQLVPFNTLIP